jgi:hypothetical protein
VPAVNARAERSGGCLVFILGAFLGGARLFVGDVVFCVFAGEGEGVAVLEVEGGQFEAVLALPGAQSDDVFDLLISEQHTQDALEDHVFPFDLIGFFLYQQFLLLVLVLHLENLLRGSLVLLAQLIEQFLHFADFLLEALVVLLHEAELLLADVALLLVLQRQLVRRRDELLLQLLDFGDQLTLFLFGRLGNPAVLLKQKIQVRLVLLLDLAQSAPQPSNFRLVFL